MISLVCVNCDATVAIISREINTRQNPLEIWNAGVSFSRLNGIVV